MIGCQKCGGLIPEQGKMYGYAGKFCLCGGPNRLAGNQPPVERPPALSEQDIRRIVREEIQKAAK